ncbi:MAG TPA: COX15/CtaA family protein [Streptosporangiaceae bacterium]
MSAQPVPKSAPQSAGAAPPLTWPQHARRWVGFLLDPSPAGMRRIALAGVVASLAIIPSGAAVRLSQSGLGCTDWPKCTAASLIASGDTGDPLIHRWVEFGNRMITTLIFVVAIAVFIAAWRYRPGRDGRAADDRQRPGRRRDLVWLAAAQPAGIVAQAVIGGIVVLTKLSPFWVSLHYLATLPVLAAAVVLHVRCTEGTGQATPLVQPLVRLVARGLVAVTSVMMVAGTLVTGTGPLAGARGVPRYHFLTLTQVAQLHADIGWVLGTTAVMLVLSLYLTEAPQRVVRLGWIVLALIGLQGVIGYAQLFAHLPAGLVWVHVTNTALIWIAVIRLNFAIRDRGLTGDDAPASADAALGAPVSH